MDAPVMEIRENGKTRMKSSSTMMLREDDKFKEKVYLYSISLSPTMYDPNDLYKPVKNGICISPVILDPIDFSARRAITMRFSPEELQDRAISHQDGVKMLAELFVTALENTEEYTPKGERAIMIRIFEDSIEPRKEAEIDLSILDKSLREFIPTPPIPRNQFIQI